MLTEEHQKWQNRIAWARVKNDEFKKKWKTSIDLFENNISNLSSGNQIKIPEVYKNLSNLLPALFSHMPILTCKTTERVGVLMADMVIKIWEYLARVGVYFPEFQKAVFSAILTGSGWCKVGTSKEEEITSLSDTEIYDNFLMQDTEEMDFNEFARKPENRELVETTDENVWVKYVPNENVLFPPDAISYETLPWIVHEILMPFEEFKDSFPGVKVEDRDLKAVPLEMDVLGTRDPILNSYKKSTDLKKVTVWEVWAKKEEKFIMMAEGVDKLLYESEWPYDDKSFPLKLLTLAPKYHSVLGMNVVEMSKLPAQIINEMAKMKEENVATGTGGIMHGKGAVTPQQAEALRRPGMNKSVEVNNTTDIRPFQTAPLPVETFTLAQEMEELIRTLFHVNEPMTQKTSSGRRPAAEWNMMQISSDKQIAFKVGRIERFVADIAGTAISYVQQLFSMEHYVTIRPKRSTEELVMKWQAQDISGKWYFNFVAGSASQQDDNLKLNQYMAFLGLLFKFVALPDAKQLIPNVGVLFEEIIKQMAKIYRMDMDIVLQAFQPNPNIPQQPSEGGTPIERMTRAAKSPGEQQVRSPMELLQSLTTSNPTNNAQAVT